MSHKRISFNFVEGGLKVIDLNTISETFQLKVDSDFAPCHPCPVPRAVAGNGLQFPILISRELYFAPSSYHTPTGNAPFLFLRKIFPHFSQKYCEI